MVKKTQSKRPTHRNTRETIKRGGSKSFSAKRAQAMGMINELAEFASLNQDITVKIINKVKDLQDLYVDESPKTPEKEEEKEEALDWLPEIESITTKSQSERRTPPRNEERTNIAKRGSWDFYILQVLDEEPKTENEVTELIRGEHPDQFKGKTPDNTVNYRLQKLVKDGRAKRVEYKKGKRTAYRYFI